MKKAKVVIIGGGFGGLNAAKAFKDTNFEVLLVDKTNHHLFQPLLYQVATAAISPGDIAKPIRSILKDQKNTEVLLDEVTAINKAGGTIELKNEGILNFDFLIVAVGARHSYFGHDEWEAHAPGLKTLNDALTIRENILLSFEKAEITEDSHEREKFLTFVVIGGGPTGIEMAGAIAEIARKTMTEDFRNIDPRQARIILIEGGDRLLSVYPEKLSDYTKNSLETMGVKVLTGKTASQVGPEGVKIGDELIPTTNVIWAAGNKASPVLNTLNAEQDRAGRVIVGPDLTVPGYPNIFVIGDAANAKDENGQPLPGLAPVAMQAGTYAGRIIISGKKQGEREPFRYVDKGTMATIGKAKAVAQIGKTTFTGFLAWLAWIFIHVMFLIGFRNKIAVMLGWFWLYISNQRPARLIVHKKLEKDLTTNGTKLHELKMEN
jgi:NADH dehydrogenase